MTTAREITRAALEPDWTLAGALVGVKPHMLAEAMANYEAALQPMTKTEPDMKQSRAAKALDIALRPIGAKLAPTMAPAVASAWRDAVLMSLAKWPANVAVAAAKAGVHEAFEYGLGDVDARLHKLAAELDARHRRALWRLQQMMREIERAANPPTPLVEDQREAKVWTQEDIERTNAMLRRAGTSIRYRLGPDGACEPCEIDPGDDEVSRDNLTRDKKCGTSQASMIEQEEA